MTHTTEECVRRELRSILRGDTYRNRFVCLPCLMSQTWVPTATCAGVIRNGPELGTNWAQTSPTRSLIRLLQERLRNREAERLGGLQI